MERQIKLAVFWSQLQCQAFDEKSMKVFVTGHRGYIGAHLVDLLKQAGHTVTGCDLGLFDDCGWEELFQRIANYEKMFGWSRSRILPVTIVSCIWRRSPTIRWAS